MTITGEIRSHFDRQLEEHAHENKLRLAALEKRLEAHQHAYTLWRKLGNSIHEGTLESVYFECEEWWDQNCLYLSPEALGPELSLFESRSTGSLSRCVSRGDSARSGLFLEYGACGEALG